MDIEYAGRRPAEDPEWTYWLDEDEITVMAGRCYVKLRQANRAIPLLTLYTSWLAGKHVQAGDIKHATALAQHTLELSVSTSSSRGDDRVTLLVQHLSPYRVVSAVRDFLDRVMERRAGR